jgi:hypothetical protein
MRSGGIAWTRWIAFLALPATASSSLAQTILWSEISSSYALPAGIRLYEGVRNSPPLKIFYADVDLNDSTLAVRSYLSTLVGGVENVAPFLGRVGALLAVNGGFFGGSTSYSAVVVPGEVLAQNIAMVTRDSLQYPLTRSFFGLSSSKRPAIDWIYHFGPSLADLYRFSDPLPNAPGTPAPLPTRSSGTFYDSLLTGIGGGPTLLKGDTIRYTYDEEVFWDSGVNGDIPDPRTAVGITASRHVILLVADGRQSESSGVTLTELATILQALGCREAMNLDGGGSTQMAARTLAGPQYVDVPSETRAVPAMLAVVYADSLPGVKQPTFEKILDTGDPTCTLIGGGWFETSNSGSWGTTRALLAPVGGGEERAVFKPGLPRMMTYDLYAWWVAAPGYRATNTPFIVRRSGGTDTIRVDQTVNGSRWQKIGTFLFAGDTTDEIAITNEASGGPYVCADALRLISYDPLFVGVEGGGVLRPQECTLENFPNPFNPSTTIRFSLPRSERVDLRMYDLLGREVARIVQGVFRAGTHEIPWTAGGVASGVYLCRLRAGDAVRTRAMVLLR